MQVKRWYVQQRAWIILACLTLVNIGLGAILWSLLTPAPHLVSGAAFEPLVGQSAPDFTLTPWQGSPIHLAAVQGRPVVLNIWASWCDPCRKEAPLLEATWQRHRQEGVLFLGVNDQDQPQAAHQFLQTYGITYPNGPDPNEQVWQAYGVRGIPTTIFIDRGGAVVRTILGEVDAATLEGEIQQLVSERGGG